VVLSLAERLAESERLAEGGCALPEWRVSGMGNVMKLFGLIASASLAAGVSWGADASVAGQSAGAKPPPAATGPGRSPTVIAGQRSAAKAGAASKASSTRSVAASGGSPPPAAGKAQKSRGRQPSKKPIIGKSGSTQRRNPMPELEPKARDLAMSAAPSHDAGPLLLYDEAPLAGHSIPGKAVKYFAVYQDSADPDARSGRIDPERVAAFIASRMDRASPPAWGMLDFEYPYDEILKKGPADHRYRTAIDSMIATIRLVRERFPATRWTYYGAPRLNYWVGGKDWTRLSASQKQAEFGRVQASYGPLLEELDWVQPSVYDKYELALGMPRIPAGSGVAEAAYRRAAVEVALSWFKSNGRTAPPILPAVSPWYQGGGMASVRREVDPAEFMSEQVRPVLEAGASGVSIWGAMSYYIRVATMASAPNTAHAITYRALSRERFAVDYLGASSVAEVDWQSADVKRRLEEQAGATMSRACRDIDALRGQQLASQPIEH
jgi:hypothetical protein